MTSEANKTKFSLLEQKVYFIDLIKNVDQKILAVWAIDCVERVMPYFEKEYPTDKRPRNALITLKEWLKTGQFSMKVIRKASLDSHAVAKELGNNNPASSVTHAAGQAVATAHVPTHAIGGAMYALQAIYRAHPDDKADQAVLTERNWQHQHLLKLINK